MKAVRREPGIMGRPPEHFPRIVALYRAVGTAAAFAELIGISERKVQRWKYDKIAHKAEAKLVNEIARNRKLAEPFREAKDGTWELVESE